MESLKAFKAGNSFDLTYYLPIDFGSALSAIYSTIRNDAYEIIENLTIESLPDDGTYSYWKITATPEQTALWPDGIFTCDIKHEGTDGEIISSDDFTVPVVRAQTI